MNQLANETRRGERRTLREAVALREHREGEHLSTVEGTISIVQDMLRLARAGMMDLWCLATSTSEERSRCPDYYISQSHERARQLGEQLREIETQMASLLVDVVSGDVRLFLEHEPEPRGTATSPSATGFDAKAARLALVDVREHAADAHRDVAAGLAKLRQIARSTNVPGLASAVRTIARGVGLAECTVGEAERLAALLPANTEERHG